MSHKSEWTIPQRIGVTILAATTLVGSIGIVTFSVYLLDEGQTTYALIAFGLGLFAFGAAHKMLNGELS